MNNLNDLSFEQLKELMADQARELFASSVLGVVFGGVSPPTTAVDWKPVTKNKLTGQYYQARCEQLGTNREQSIQLI